MSNLNEIGLNTEKSKKNAEKLNKLLANYSIFYQNTRGFHWNIKGDKFFELHVKFEELYNDLKVKIDEVAERILTLGYTAEHRYSKYNSESIIDESELISDGLEAVENILNSYSTILTMQREILDTATDANDEGTVALMSDYIQQQEKEVWMYSSLLNK
ncbi:Dps family protein [uncultured Salegentibacter sp.]|uniref:Dps family protein n=1 Tax=uncultured Salegentibacter sp. TaxID=259320 RepID=UPI0030DCC56E